MPTPAEIDQYRRAVERAQNDPNCTQMDAILLYIKGMGLLLEKIAEGGYDHEGVIGETAVGRPDRVSG